MWHSTACSQLVLVLLCIIFAPSLGKYSSNTRWPPPTLSEAKDLDFELNNDAFNLRMLQMSVPGIPGQDYPIHSRVPDSNFTCQGKVPGGYYADIASSCQAYHVCTIVTEGPNDRGYSFLCPNGTIFNQERFVCDWWFNSDCSQAASHYQLNDGRGGRQPTLRVSLRRKPFLAPTRVTTRKPFTVTHQFTTNAPFEVSSHYATWQTRYRAPAATTTLSPPAVVRTPNFEQALLPPYAATAQSAYVTPKTTPTTRAPTTSSHIAPDDVLPQYHPPTSVTVTKQSHVSSQTYYPRPQKLPQYKKPSYRPSYKPPTEKKHQSPAVKHNRGYIRGGRKPWVWSFFNG